MGTGPPYCGPIQKAGGSPKNIMEQRTIPRNIKTSSSVGPGIAPLLIGRAGSQDYWQLVKITSIIERVYESGLGFLPPEIKQAVDCLFWFERCYGFDRREAKRLDIGDIIPLRIAA